jgi:hypothetical protein
MSQTTTSQRRIDANRRNAQKSTGPTSPAGKAKVSMNALKHGLSAQTEAARLSDEDATAYAALEHTMLLDMAPRCTQELLLVKRVTAAYCRLQRLHRIEAEILERDRYYSRKHIPFLPHNEFLQRAQLTEQDLLTLPESEIHQRYLAAEQQYFAELPPPPAPEVIDRGLAHGFCTNLDSLRTLHRYETTLTRELHRTLRDYHLLRTQPTYTEDTPDEAPLTPFLQNYLDPPEPSPEQTPPEISPDSAEIPSGEIPPTPSAPSKTTALQNKPNAPADSPEKRSAWWPPHRPKPPKSDQHSA